MFFISIFYTIISMALLYLNIRLLSISQDKADSQHYIDSRLFGALIILETLWTHGLMQALSDFTFESIGIHWYFNEKKYGPSYSRISKNLCSTIGLTIKHMGTISYGQILSYIPETLNNLLGSCEDSNKGCYTMFCCLHKFTFSKLSKYCYCETILQSDSFCESNIEMYKLRKKTKSVLP